MKSIKPLTLLLLTSILISSCIKGNIIPVVTPPGGTTTTGGTTPPAATTGQTLSLKYNDTVKSTSIVAAVYDKIDGVMLISGAFTSGGTITTSGVTMSITNVKAGTFDVSDGITQLIYSAKADIADTYIADTGSVTITTLTADSVKGTFAFTSSTLAGAKVVISDGKFTAKVTSQ